MPCSNLVQINFVLVKTILDTKPFGTEICTEKAFLAKFKIFGRNLFWKPKKSKSESKPKSFIYQFELRKLLLLMTLFDCSNVFISQNMYNFCQLPE